MKTREDVLKEARESKIDFIHLQFTDIFGVMKNISIGARQLEKALNNEIMFDGSSIDGFVRIEESDMYLHPDPSTWQIASFGEDEHTARMICDVYNTSGEPFAGDPRYILKRAIAEAAKLGYEVNMGPEAEFFLFHTDAQGAPTLHTHDNASYFDLAPVDLGAAARREMVKVLESVGFEIEASHHECAPGQHEIDFHYANALKTADNLQTFKLIVRRVAQLHGLHATFMPKPIYGVAGSGMHVNQSLYQPGGNAFYDAADERGLSQVAYWYLGGLLRHAKEFTAITNPTVNSYKRLVAGFEAPVYIAWASRNRSPLVRIPSARGAGTRMELRSPDPTCNPYLAFAAMIWAGLDGVKNQIAPPDPLEVNLFDMDEAARCRNQVETIPTNLSNATRELSSSQLMREALGEHVFARYIDAKIQEWCDYRVQITEWELEHYLNKF